MPVTEKKNRSMIQRRLIPSYIFLTIVSFISVFPLYWMITAATNKSVDVARGKIFFGNYLMQNWQRLNQLQDLGGAMKNSFIYAAVQTVLALFICSLQVSALSCITIRRRTFFSRFFFSL